MFSKKLKAEICILKDLSPRLDSYIIISLAGSWQLKRPKPMKRILRVIDFNAVTTS